MVTPHQKSKILVVDDEPTNLKLLRGILREDYALVFARNGREMLRYAAEGPDLILLDIMMPDMDGYEGCVLLKESAATRDIPVIFVTAKITVEDEVRGLESGAVDYITKPVHGPVVRARVKTHLALQQAQKVIEQQNQEIKKQNDELKETARLRDDVEQIVRHDLKSPLNQIIGAPNALLAQMTLDPLEKELLQGIEEAGYRMLNMINRSHDLYKMERGFYQLQPMPVDILAVLKKITPELQEKIERKNLSLTIFLNGQPAGPGDAFFISGEELLCHSMLANLLKNAVEASPKTETVTISLKQGDPPTIVIGNKGSVPTALRDTFFKKFATSGKPTGVGLGTYSAKLTAVTQGGDIYLDTSKEGETSLLIQLPVSAITLFSS